MLLTDAPTHPDAPLWKASCEAYADYLRGISQLIEPYGILPSAVYEVDNTDYKNLYHEGEQVGLPQPGRIQCASTQRHPSLEGFLSAPFPRRLSVQGIPRHCHGQSQGCLYPCTPIQ